MGDELIRKEIVQKNHKKTPRKTVEYTPKNDYIHQNNISFNISQICNDILTFNHYYFVPKLS